jgi:cellobiose transport system permease protein
MIATANRINGSHIKTFIGTFLIALVSLIALLPFYIMFMMGTYSTSEIFQVIPLIPGSHLLENLHAIFASDFLRYYFNSTYIAVLGTAGSVFVSTLAGFAFAKYDFKGRNLLFSAVLVTMMVPSQLGLVAFAAEMRLLGWTNTHLPLIIPGMAHAFGVFWMTQYMKTSVPNEVLDSARIDGCSDFKTFVRIVIPYVAPAMVTLILLVFIASWNSYLIPLIILNKTELYTIPLGIATLGSYFRTDYAIRITGLSLGTIPLILIFAAGSKYFIKGLMAGAVKG